MKLSPKYSSYEIQAKALGQYTGGNDADRTSEGLKILAMVEKASSTELTEQDRIFVVDMLEKRKRHGAGLLVTGRQLFWLRDVKDKLIEKGVI